MTMAFEWSQVLEHFHLLEEMVESGGRCQLVELAVDALAVDAAHFAGVVVVDAVDDADDRRSPRRRR